MKLLLVFFAMLLSLNGLTGQNLYEKFANYYPKEIAVNPAFAKAENTRLERYASINPELIYLYFRKLELMYSDINMKEKKRFEELFVFELNYGIEKRNEWIDEAIRTTGVVLDYGFFRLEVIGHLEDMRIESYTEVLHRVNRKDYASLLDANKMNYMSLLAITDEVLPEFSSERDYLEPLQKALAQKAKHFQNYYDNRSNLKDDLKKQVVDELANFLFLFENEYLKRYSHLALTLDYFLIEFLSDRSHFDYQPQKAVFHRRPFSVLAGINNSSGEPKTIYTIKNSLVNEDISVAFDNSFFCKFGYNISLYPNDFYFSALKLELGVFNKKVIKPDDFKVTHVYWNPATYYAAGDYNINDVKVENSLGISFTMSTPVLRLHDNWYFDSGFSLEYINIEGSLREYFDGRYDIYDPSVELDFLTDRTVEFAKSEFLVKFNIAMNIVIFDRFGLVVSAANFNEIGTGIGVYF
jgi:hypothetical protein